MQRYHNFKIEPKYTEKRNFVRMQINTAISLTIHETGDAISAICCNLSSDGLLFTTTTQLAIGTKATIYLNSPNNKFNQFQALIEVIRLADDLNKTYAYGAKILNIY